MSNTTSKHKYLISYNMDAKGWPIKLPQARIDWAKFFSQQAYIIVKNNQHVATKLCNKKKRININGWTKLV